LEKSKKKTEIPYIKPYKIDKKRPIDADNILRERLKDIIKKGVKVFFMDESGIRHDLSRVFVTCLGILVLSC
jgi:hypothetical protein